MLSPAALFNNIVQSLGVEALKSQLEQLRGGRIDDDAITAAVECVSGTEEVTESTESTESTEAMDATTGHELSKKQKHANKRKNSYHIQDFVVVACIKPGTGFGASHHAAKLVAHYRTNETVKAFLVDPDTPAFVGQDVTHALIKMIDEWLAQESIGSVTRIVIVITRNLPISQSATTKKDLDQYAVFMQASFDIRQKIIDTFGFKSPCNTVYLPCGSPMPSIELIATALARTINSREGTTGNVGFSLRTRIQEIATTQLEEEPWFKAGKTTIDDLNARRVAAKKDVPANARAMDTNSNDMVTCVLAMAAVDLGFKSPDGKSIEKILDADATVSLIEMYDRADGAWQVARDNKPLVALQYEDATAEHKKAVEEFIARVATAREALVADPAIQRKALESVIKIFAEFYWANARIMKEKCTASAPHIPDAPSTSAVVPSGVANILTTIQSLVGKVGPSNYPVKIPASGQIPAGCRAHGDGKHYVVLRKGQEAVDGLVQQITAVDANELLAFAEAVQCEDNERMNINVDYSQVVAHINKTMEEALTTAVEGRTWVGYVVDGGFAFVLNGRTYHVDSGHVTMAVGPTYTPEERKYIATLSALAPRDMVMEYAVTVTGTDSDGAGGGGAAESVMAMAIIPDPNMPPHPLVGGSAHLTVRADGILPEVMRDVCSRAHETLKATGHDNCTFKTSDGASVSVRRLTESVELKDMVPRLCLMTKIHASLKKPDGKWDNTLLTAPTMSKELASDKITPHAVLQKISGTNVIAKNAAGYVHSKSKHGSGAHGLAGNAHPDFVSLATAAIANYLSAFTGSPEEAHIVANILLEQLVLIGELMTGHDVTLFNDHVSGGQRADAFYTVFHGAQQRNMNSAEHATLDLFGTVMATALMGINAGVMLVGDKVRDFLSKVTAMGFTVNPWMLSLNAHVLVPSMQQTCTGVAETVVPEGFIVVDNATNKSFTTDTTPISRLMDSVLAAGPKLTSSPAVLEYANAMRIGLEQLKTERNPGKRIAILHDLMHCIPRDTIRRQLVPERHMCISELVAPVQAVRDVFVNDNGHTGRITHACWKVIESANMPFAHALMVPLDTTFDQCDHGTVESFYESVGLSLPSDAMCAHMELCRVATKGHKAYYTVIKFGDGTTMFLSCTNPEDRKGEKTLENGTVVQLCRGTYMCTVVHLDGRTYTTLNSSHPARKKCDVASSTGNKLKNPAGYLGYKSATIAAAAAGAKINPDAPDFAFNQKRFFTEVQTYAENNLKTRSAIPAHFAMMAKLYVLLKRETFWTREVRLRWTMGLSGDIIRHALTVTDVTPEEMKDAMQFLAPAYA